VIDRPHAGADAGLDAVGAVEMRGHVLAPSRRFFDGHVHLVFGVLLRARRRSLRQDRPRPEDLDEIGALLEIRSDRLADFVGTVGEVPHDRHVNEDRELARVACSAGRRHIVP
jgi:hypothetical protein